MNSWKGFRLFGVYEIINENDVYGNRLFLRSLRYKVFCLVSAFNLIFAFNGYDVCKHIRQTSNVSIIMVTVKTCV
ncbi:MAG: hypothetical protein KHW62_01285 [Clostridiales bacterium]|nr:hypothetical protein [Clostridiales bacterium]